MLFVSGVRRYPDRPGMTQPTSSIAARLRVALGRFWRAAGYTLAGLEIFTFDEITSASATECKRSCPILQRANGWVSHQRHSSR